MFSSTPKRATFDFSSPSRREESGTETIKSVFERRKQSFFDSLERIVSNSGGDKIINQMFHDKTSTYYIPDRICELIDKYLKDDREEYISDLYRRMRCYEACFGESKRLQIEDIGGKILKEIDKGGHDKEKIRFLRSKLPLIESGPNTIMVRKDKVIELKEMALELSTKLAHLEAEVQIMKKKQLSNVLNMKKAVSSAPLFKGKAAVEKMLAYKEYIKESKANAELKEKKFSQELKEHISNEKTLKETNDKLRAENLIQQNQIESLQSALSQMQSINRYSTRKEAEYEEMEAENKSLKAQLQEKDDQLQSLMEKKQFSKEMDKTFQQAIDKSKQIITKKNEQILKLKEALKSASSEYDSIVYKLSLSQADNDVLNAKLAKVSQLQKDNELKAIRIEELERERDLNRKTIKDSYAENEHISKENMEIKELASTLQQKLEAKEKESKEAQKKMKRLTMRVSELDESTSKEYSAEEELKSTKEKIVQSESAIQVLTKQISTITQRDEKLTAENAKLSNENVALKYDLDQKQQMFESFAQTTEKIKSEHTKLLVDYNTMKDKHDKMKTEYQAMQATLAEKDKNMEEILERAESLRIKVETRNKEDEENRRKAQESEKKCQEYDSKIKQLNATIETLKEQNDAICERFAMLRTESSEHSSQISRAESEKLKLQRLMKTTVEQTTKETELMQRELQKYKQDYEIASQELTEARKTIIEQKEQLEQLETSLRTTETDFEHERSKFLSDSKRKDTLLTLAQEATTKTKKHKEELLSIEKKRLKEEMRNSIEQLTHEKTNAEKRIEVLTSQVHELEDILNSNNNKLQQEIYSLTISNQQLKFELEQKKSIDEILSQMQSNFQGNTLQQTIEQLQQMVNERNELKSMISSFTESNKTIVSTISSPISPKTPQDSSKSNASFSPKMNTTQASRIGFSPRRTENDQTNIIIEIRTMKDIISSLLNKLPQCRDEISYLPSLIQDYLDILRNIADLLHTEDFYSLPNSLQALMEKNNKEKEELTKKCESEIQEMTQKYESIVEPLSKISTKSNQNPEEAVKYLLNIQGEIDSLPINGNNTLEKLENFITEKKRLDNEKSNSIIALQNYSSKMQGFSQTEESRINISDSIKNMRRDMNTVAEFLENMIELYRSKLGQVPQFHDIKIRYPLEESLRTSISLCIDKIRDIIKQEEFQKQSILADSKRYQYTGDDVLEAVEVISHGRENESIQILQSKQEAEKKALQANSEILLKNANKEIERLRQKISELSQTIIDEKERSMSREKDLLSQTEMAKQLSRNAVINVEREHRVREELIRIIEKKPVDSNFLKTYLSSQEMRTIENANI